MINALKKNLSPRPSGKWGKLTKCSTQRHHQANEGKSGLAAEWVPVLRALRSFLSETKLAARKRRETHCLSHEEKEQLIEDYAEREIAVARKHVEDAETAIEQEQDGMRNVEKVGLTTTKPETTLDAMLNPIGDSLSNLASTDDQADGECEDDDEEDPVWGKLSEDYEPGRVISTISKMVQYRTWRVWQKQMKLDKSTQQAGETLRTTSVRGI